MLKRVYDPNGAWQYTTFFGIPLYRRAGSVSIYGWGWFGLVCAGNVRCFQVFGLPLWKSQEEEAV